MKQKNAKRKTKTSLVQVLILAMMLSSGANIIHAQELSTYDKNRMLGATSVDWQSTNLREWLNSDKNVVDYTGIKPSYKDEAGFLSSKNFTQAERDAIAITRHGAGHQYSLGGNVNDTLYISQRSVVHNDFVYNDKVFILHYTDLDNYIEKNKQLMDSNKKYYSNYLQQQTNRKDKYEYVMNSGYYNSGYTNVSVLYTSVLNQVNVRNTQNVVPALSLNPNYTLSNGKKAKDLTLGSTVFFGKYNGEPIEWQVINKTDNGYPLLWSTKIIAMKEYDAPGDINPHTSNYIHFPNYDIDIVSGSGQAKSWETGTNINSKPVITFDNQSVLTTPTNDTSITLKIRATDTNYSIRRIILPNGTVVNGNYAEWTITQNGEYDIIAENSIGVMTVRHIVTKAINTPATVNIVMNKDESTKWSNKPVNVTISASNNGVYTLTALGERNMGYGNSNSGVFSAWMSLGGKRLKVTGTLKNAMTDQEASQVDMNASVRIRLSMKWYNDHQVGWTWPIIKSFTLKELKEKGEIKIDEVYTIPSNAYNYVSPYVTFMDSNSAYMKAPYDYWMSNFVFELLDKDDLKIEEIHLPDGNIVYADHASYTISENGSYVFSVKDNRGKFTSKTIDLAIDTVKPNLEVRGIPNHFVKEEVIQLVATDNLSGVKSIKLPNGEYRTTSSEGQSLSVDYNIIDNGDYTFEVLDYAGNKYTKTVTISNIDKQPPSITLTPNILGWTNKNVIIQVEAKDDETGILKIQLPNGNWINSNKANYSVETNGTFTFVAEDKMGNKSSQSITINNIDNIIPTKAVITTNEDWINASSVSVSMISGVDMESGTSHAEYKLEGATNQGWTIYQGTFQVINEGETKIIGRTVDNVGNPSIEVASFVRIDRSPPHNTRITIELKP